MLVGDFGRVAVVAAPGAWLKAAGAATTVAVCGVTVAFADDAELLVTFGGVCSNGFGTSTGFGFGMSFIVTIPNFPENNFQVFPLPLVVNQLTWRDFLLP